MVAQVGSQEAVDRAAVSVEEAIAAAFRAMREFAAKAGTEDYVDPWCAEVLDARPLVVVAAVGAWDTRVWLMEPGPGKHTVFSAVVEHPTASLGEFLWADTLGKTKLLDTIRADVGWLVAEATGSVHEP
jgi:hypothetical protein